MLTFFRIVTWCMAALGAIFWTTWIVRAAFYDVPFRWNAVLFGFGMLVAWVFFTAFLFPRVIGKIARGMDSEPGEWTPLAGQAQYQGQDLGVPRIEQIADGRLTFRKSRGSAVIAWVFLLAGGLMLVSSVIWPGVVEDPVAACGLAVLLLVIGLMALAWINDLTLDPARRVYESRYGVRPFNRRLRGSFEDFDHVSLEYEPGDSDSYPSWPVFLVWKGSLRPKRKLTSRPWGPSDGNPTVFARKDGEWFAALLGVPLIDNTERGKQVSKVPSGRSLLGAS
jgi:hypothetical protein